jgi:hypothetical protein
MAFINAGGETLFMKFVRHLKNYSVMQLVERLFLHQPGWERDGRCLPLWSSTVRERQIESR